MAAPHTQDDGTASGNALKPLARSAVLYLIGGVLSVMIDVGGTFAAYVAGLGVSLAATLGMGVSVLFNFWFNATFTFSTKMSRAVFGRYLVALAANYAVMLGIVNVCVDLFGLHITAAKMVSLTITTPVLFLVSQAWIYRDD